MPFTGQPLASTLVGCCVHFKWKPFVDVGHELFVVLGIKLQLIVDRHDDSEAVFFVSVSLGCVDQELVILEQQLHGTEIGTTIYIEHHKVETCNAVFFVAMAIGQVVSNPVHTVDLSQLVELVKWCELVDVVESNVIAVADNAPIQRAFLERFASEELNPIRERFLDDDVVLVAVGNGQVQHFLLLACSTTIERQVFYHVCLSHITLARRNVFGQLDIRTVTGQQTVEGISRFFSQFDGLVEVVLGQLRRIVNKRIGSCQLQSFEVAVRDFCLLDFFMLWILLSFTLTLEPVLDQQQACFLAHLQSLVDVDNVSKVFQLG